MATPGSVTVKIRYNGYVHTCYGFIGRYEDGIQVHILASNLPRGYRAEHMGDQADLTVQEEDLVSDTSGVSEWELPEVFDLDSRLL
jgi:hypothetical protein